MRRGFLWAVLATLAFGVTTPLIGRVDLGAGPWSTAAWLYVGGALFALAAHRKPAALGGGLRTNWRSLTSIAVIGGMLAPAAYIVGLRDAGALATSLALNMEAPFSAAIAVWVFGEHLGRRAVAAMSAIVIGGGALVLGPGMNGSRLGVRGMLFVTVATALWAVDNALSSRLPNLDPRITIFWKSAIGGTLSLLTAIVLGEPWGTAATIVALLIIGAIGYGASLLFYLVAQRQFGIARTASIFAVAPFIGAAGAVLSGDRQLNGLAVIAAAAMIVGVWLHVTERHDHQHRHHRQDHEHAHRHDDDHHVHAHADIVSGAHSHRHEHAPIVHAHEHASNSQHAHAHNLDEHERLRDEGR